MLDLTRASGAVVVVRCIRWTGHEGVMLKLLLREESCLIHNLSWNASAMTE